MSGAMDSHRIPTAKKHRDATCGSEGEQWPRSTEFTRPQMTTQKELSSSRVLVIYCSTWPVTFNVSRAAKTKVILRRTIAMKTTRMTMGVGGLRGTPANFSGIAPRHGPLRFAG